MYTLNKTRVGKKNQYKIIDENNNIVFKRVSSKDYVACTINGDFFFGRLDLIGKGEHGKRLARASKILNNPVKAYSDFTSGWTPESKKQWETNNPYEIWLKKSTEYAIDLINRMKVVYLK